MSIVGAKSACSSGNFERSDNFVNSVNFNKVKLAKLEHNYLFSSFAFSLARYPLKISKSSGVVSLIFLSLPAAK